MGVTALAKPYPQYGGLTVIDGIDGGNMIYHSLQIKATKSFSNGYTLLFGYNYHVQVNQTFYDNVDNYLQQWTGLDWELRATGLPAPARGPSPLARDASS